MFICRSVTAQIGIYVAQNGNLTVYAAIRQLENYIPHDPYDLNIDLKDVIELSIGPRDNYDGIRSCITYNPPRGSKPGYQIRRGVSVGYFLRCSMS